MESGRSTDKNAGPWRSKHSDRAADAAVKKKIALTAKEFTWLWYIGRSKSIPPPGENLIGSCLACVFLRF